MLSNKLITSISINSKIYHKARIFMAENRYRSFSELVEKSLIQIMDDKNNGI